MSPPFVPKLDNMEDTKYFLKDINNGLNNTMNNKQITNIIKRTNNYLNQDNNGDK